MESIKIFLDIIHYTSEGLVIVGGLFLIFGKSYFSEKGKNLATKEDIAEITKTVGAIKSQLDYSTQSKINIKTEERNAVVNCFEKFSVWQNVISDSYLGSIQEKNKLSELELIISEAKTKYDISYSRMQLFVNNRELSNAFNNAAKKNLDLQHETENVMSLTSLWLSDYQSYKAGAGIVPDGKRQTELMDRRHSFNLNFLSKKTAILDEINLLEGELQLQAYHYIQSLLENVQV